MLKEQVVQEITSYEHDKKKLIKHYGREDAGDYLKEVYAKAILNLFKSEVDKLTVIDDGEIHKHYLYIKDPFIPRYLDVGRQDVEAQLQHTKNELDLMGE